MHAVWSHYSPEDIFYFFLFSSPIISHYIYPQQVSPSEPSSFKSCFFNCLWYSYLILSPTNLHFFFLHFPSLSTHSKHYQVASTKWPSLITGQHSPRMHWLIQVHSTMTFSSHKVSQSALMCLRRTEPIHGLFWIELTARKATNIDFLVETKLNFLNRKHWFPRICERHDWEQGEFPWFLLLRVASKALHTYLYNSVIPIDLLTHAFILSYASNYSCDTDAQW